MAYITLPTFVGFSTSSGPKRATFVHQARRLHENPERGAFDFYRRPVNAIRAGRASGMDKASMASLVEQANFKSKAHFLAVGTGWLNYLGHRAPSLVDIGHGRWHHGNFELGVNPQLGLRKANGRVLATWLYLKADPLSQDGANLALWIMEQIMDDLLPGAEAMVIDVRRSKEYFLSKRDRTRVGPWVLSEASSFLTLWDIAA